MQYSTYSMLLQEALVRADESVSAYSYKANILAHLGFLCVKQEMYAQALTFYEDALELAYYQEDHDLINTILPNIAVAYLSLGDAATALLFLNQNKLQPANIRRTLEKRTEEDISKETGVSLRETTGPVQAATYIRALTVRAFGEPAVLLDEEPIKRWRTTRAMELFFFLLDIDHPVSKERIMSELWSHSDAQISQSFHSTVHHLRKALGTSCLIFRAGCYSLDLATSYGEQIWYDVKAFQMHHTQAKLALRRADDVTARTALSQMIALYRGDYGRPFYNNWCIIRRDKLRTAYMEALRQLAHIAWRQNAFVECAKHWQHLLHIDNCLEEAHFGLMQCYAHQGKRSLALRQYEECRMTLQQELGVEPEATTQHFYQFLISSPASIPGRLQTGHGYL